MLNFYGIFWMDIGLGGAGNELMPYFSPLHFSYFLQAPYVFIWEDLTNVVYQTLDWNVLLRSKFMCTLLMESVYIHVDDSHII